MRRGRRGVRPGPASDRSWSGRVRLQPDCWRNGRFFLKESPMKTTNRRSFIRRGAAAAAAAAAVAVPKGAAAQTEKPVKKVHYPNGRKPEKPPLFNGIVSYGNLLFI